MKILIADDDSVSRHFLQYYLEKWGYAVTAAQDGAEAWRLFEAGVFPMVITDWMMPELDGAEFIRRIRACQRPGYVYAILLSARSQKEDRVEGMEAGADDFLTKPFDRDELRVRLRAGERIIRLEHHLREAQSALIQNEQLASVGRLAAGVAHEINNPIAYVMNNIAVLRRDVRCALKMLDIYGEGRDALNQAQPDLAEALERLEEESDVAYVKENLDRIFESTAQGLRRIRAIVQNLRDFARLDEAQFKEVELSTALESTLSALRHELDEKALRLATDFQQSPAVACNPGKLNQMFYNIVLNAIQASAREGLLEIRTRSDGDHMVTVEVEDHGSGISAEHLPHIFEPFFTTKPVGCGTGLGLSVSYGIARDHGGSLEVESRAGQGSLFRIRLPVEPLKSARVSETERVQ
jgi:signal transduction histidine kinase